MRNSWDGTQQTFTCSNSTAGHNSEVCSKLTIKRVESRSGGVYC